MSLTFFAFCFFSALQHRRCHAVQPWRPDYAREHLREQARNRVPAESPHPQDGHLRRDRHVNLLRTLAWPVLLRWRGSGNLLLRLLFECVSRRSSIKPQVHLKPKSISMSSMAGTSRRQKWKSLKFWALIFALAECSTISGKIESTSSSRLEYDAADS